MKRLFRSTSLVLIVALLLSAGYSVLAQSSACTAGDATFYYNRAVRAHDSGIIDEALDNLDCAIELDPDYTEAYVLRAAVHYDRADYGMAAEDYRYVIEATPTDTEAWFRLGYSLLEMGSPEEAIAVYSTYIDLEPRNSYGYNNRGAAYASMGDMDTALTNYNRAIELDPTNAIAISNRASIYMDRELYDLALADLNQALKQSSSYPALYLSRAVLYELTDRVDDAVDDFWEWVQAIEVTVIEQQNFEMGARVRLTLAEGTVHYIPFQAEFGQVVVARVIGEEEQDTAVDPLLVLLNIDGEPVAANDDGAGGMDSELRGYAIPEDGEYTLVVTHAGGGSAGHVRVTLDLEDGLIIGDRITVHTTIGDFLFLRSQPGLDSRILERLPAGTRGTVLEGPVSADGYVWWRISVAGETVEGWAVLAADGERTLIRR